MRSHLMRVRAETPRRRAPELHDQRLWGHRDDAVGRRV